MRFSKTVWALVVALVVAFFVVPLLLKATPGAGFVFNYLSRFTSVKDAIHERAHDHEQHWSLELEVEGPTDFVQQDVMLAPGGFSGWHSHPGPVLITVKSGIATWYNAEDPTCTPIVYPTGSAFIEPANVNHFVGNHETTNLELLNTYVIPMRVATRKEQAQPSQCPF
jgi:quercetin dioxygenase-like cupin family protein